VSLGDWDAAGVAVPNASTNRKAKRARRVM